MAERLEFREKLAGILTLCESQNNITDKATVEAYFAEDNLSAEQMELVFDYLLSKKVIVKGYVKVGGSIKNAENTEEPIRYTQEEQDYLNKIGKEIAQMKEGSIALVNQITTVSKIRIFDPRNLKGVLSGISLSEESMEKINAKLKELYVFR